MKPEVLCSKGKTKPKKPTPKPKPFSVGFAKPFATPVASAQACSLALDISLDAKCQRDEGLQQEPLNPPAPGLLGRSGKLCRLRLAV